MNYADAFWLDTAGRLLIGGFFVVAGLCNLTQQRIRDHIEALAGFGVPLPAAAFWFGMTLQFTGCALLLTGWHADIGVLVLIVFTVVANGRQEILSVTLDPEIVKAQDQEMLQDLIVAGVNDALKKAQAMMADEMKGLTGGMGLNIPGLF